MKLRLSDSRKTDGRASYLCRVLSMAVLEPEPRSLITIGSPVRHFIETVSLRAKDDQVELPGKIPLLQKEMTLMMSRNQLGPQ